MQDTPESLQLKERAGSLHKLLKTINFKTLACRGTFLADVLEAIYYILGC